ncbi:MAG: hypothetical protein ACTSPI_05735, partial [Candidatus Heimdallarchaeaceae archaeon]
KEISATEILNIKSKKSVPSLIYTKALETLETKKENDLFSYHRKEFTTEPSETWSTYPEMEIPYYVKLKNIAFVGVGMVSGFDKAFKINDEELKDFKQEEKRKTIFPFIKGEHCKGFHVDGKANYILLDNCITTESELKSSYPHIYKRFLPYKEQMKNRYLPHNKKWFHWQALRNFNTYLDLLDQPKIFVPTLDRSKENRFSITEEKVFPAGDVIAIIPLIVDKYFLLGYLNSHFFRQYYLASGARRGHRISYTQRLLANAKIPLFKEEIMNEISSLTRSIILEKKVIKQRTLIDNLIKKAFKNNLFEKEGKEVKD